MSAFMVSKLHVDLIVKLALDGPRDAATRWYKPSYAADADKLGDILIQANLDSICARYPDIIDNPDACPGPTDQYWHEPYVYADPGYQPTIVEGLKAIACLAYQSCEFDGWEACEAHRFCQALESELIDKLPGFNAAPWGWDKLPSSIPSNPKLARKLARVGIKA